MQHSVNLDMSNYKKIGFPVQQGLVPRTHLLDKMSGILNFPITILSAPSGCGKTALATQLADNIKADVIWQTISPFEQDFWVFLRRMLKSLEVVTPNITSLQAILQQPVENIAYEITSYLQEYLTQDVVLVIDDWHILKNTVADQWLQLFLDTMPDKCHLFIIGRHVPNLNMLQLIANRRLLNITQQELFFTQAEVYLLAVKINQQDMSQEKAETVWKRLQGWPVGTILALQPMPQILESQTETGIEPSETLFQSIAAEMLRQQLPDIQHFLKWTSTGEYFNSEICENVFNITDWEFLLSEITQQNLFVSQQAGGYRYHQLFRTFLQTHFKLNQLDEYKSAHRRIAGWYQSQNQLDEAIEHFILAGDINSAVKLAESIVHAYYAQGRIDSILQLGQKLQTYQIPMPNLDHIRAQIYLSHEVDSEKALKAAEQSLQGYRAIQNQYYIHDVKITLGMIHQMHGNLLTACDIFNEVIQDEDLHILLRGNALNQLGLTEYYLGDNKLAIEHFQQALEIMEANSSLFDRAKLYQELELVYRDVGDVVNANECLEKQIYLWRKLNNPEPLAMALNNLGYRYYEQGQYALAKETYQQGIDSIVNLHSSRTRYYLLASLGDLQRDSGQFIKARSSYQQALNLIAGREPYAQAEVLTNLSTLYRWQLKYEAALTCANDAITISREHNLKQREVLAQVAQWHIRLQPWSLSDIESEIQKTLSHHPRLENDKPIEFITLKLRMAILSSNITATQSLLQHLTHLENKERSIQPFIVEAMYNPEIGSFWKPIQHQYPTLKRAYDTRKRIPEKKSRIVSLAPDTHSLHLYTLGIERIRKNNAYIKIAETYAEKIRAFLYYFVFMGKGTREELGRIFWADKPMEAQKDNFHQTLARLRSSLGNKIILHDDSTMTYELNPDIQFWCDALQLESFVTEARRLSHFNQYTFNLWYQATQLTYGEFLPGLDYQWIQHRRHHFFSLSIEAWMGLARCHRQQGDFHSALVAYEKIESFAPYHEAAYRGRMECYSHLGETASITTIYKSLEQRLSRDLQVKPSSQSYQLYRQLISTAS